MTVLTTAATTSPMAGNGATTVFDYTFIIPFLEDGVTPAVNVWYFDLAGNKNYLAPNVYTIAGVGNPGGGTVTYSIAGTPIAVGTFLQIDRAVPFIQPDVFPNQSFLPESVEDALDNLEEQIQQLLGGVAQVAVNSPVVMSVRYFGAGTVPTPGILFPDLYCPFPPEVTQWTIQADQAGSIELDIWAKPFAPDSPPDASNSICPGHYPALVAHQQEQSSDLTGWTTNISSGCAFRFNLRSIATITSFTLSLTLKRDSTFVGAQPGTGGGGGGGGGGSGALTLAGDVIGAGVVPGTIMTAIQNNAVTNPDLAQAPALTVKGNPTGGTANVTDIPNASLAALLAPYIETGAAVQGIFFSLAGGAFTLLDSFPAGAAGPTGSRTGVGTVDITLGSTALPIGYYVGGGGKNPATTDAVGIYGPNGTMVAGGTYSFGTTNTSNRTLYDTDRVFLLFY